jgi:transposase
VSVAKQAGSARAGGWVGERFAGVDWAKDDHVVCVVDDAGVVVERVTVAHQAAGLARLVRLLTRYAVAAVGIERGDGPLVDVLLEAGLPVFVIAPGQIRALRGRYGSAGNKDDRFDAFVLADVVRTDRARLTPMQVDCEQTVLLRRLCRSRKDLVSRRVATANQLRAHLDSALPAVVGLFADLDSPVSLAFMTRFATQDAVDRLTEARLQTWLARRRYPGRSRAAVLLEHIRAAPRGPVGEFAAGLAAITAALAATLVTLSEQIKILEARIAAVFDQHPDKAIFAGLPKAGTVRAARLLGEIGDARARFPTAASLACLAGAAPSTRQSGRTKVVAFRWGADKHLRDAVCDFAGDSHHANAWAAQLYHAARDRGCDHQHAVRILARAWINIIWKCWTTRTPYDQAKHRQLQHILTQTG